MAASNRLQVLVVECDETVRKTAVAAVQAAGFAVAGCSNHLDSAWERVLQQKPDVMLLGKVAEDFSAVISAAQRWVKEYAVAVVHLVSDAAYVTRLLESDAGECVTVPFSQEQLAVSIQVALARRRQADDRPFWTEMNVLQALPEGVLVTDFAGRLRLINRTAQRLLEVSAEAALGRDVAEVYRVWQTDGTVASAIPASQGAGAPRLLLLPRGPHEVDVIEDRHTVLRDATGSVTGMAIIFRVLSRKEAGTRAFASWGDSVTDPLLVLDAGARCSFGNAAAARIFGVTVEALLGRSLWEMLPAQVRERHETGFAQAWQRREAQVAEWFMEGAGAWYEVRSYPHQEGRLLWMTDITSRKLEWERGNRLDRLESLGLLARGFAHDFNNLLTVLLGNLSLAEQRFADESGRLAEVHAARQATVQAQGLVQQLLTFARGGVPVKRAVLPTALVRHFFEQHPRTPGIQYVLETSDDAPEMALDPNQIRRLLGNLIRNAEQASAHGGIIHVRCEAADAGSLFPGEVPADAPATVAGVVIEVEDHGEGIASQHLAHIFEPYFTTRKAQNATGLGLTVCESIARAHGGTINVYAVKPQGTRVRLFLPVEEELETGNLVSEQTKGATLSPEARQTPRILVLEDDHLVRALLLRGLQGQGYEVTETIDGHETVRLYEQAMKAGQPFDLVILDLSIPNGMGGLRTMEKLRALDPQVLAMVSSGYSDDPAMAQPAAYGFAAVLPKPYEPQELILMVQQLLDARMNPAA